MSIKTLEFITKANCPLCAEAEAIVRAFAESVGATILKKDIADDRELAAEFWARVPVVRRDGNVLAEGRISLRQLRER